MKKTCSQCRNPKDVSYYYADSSGKYTDGYKPQCKECHMAGIQGAHLKKRNELLTALGGKCQKCGESNLDILGFKNVESKRFNSLMSSSNAGKKMKEIQENPHQNSLICMACHHK